MDVCMYRNGWDVMGWMGLMGQGGCMKWMGPPGWRGSMDAWILDLVLVLALVVMVVDGRG